jgi:hypothetical protein
MVQTIDDFAVEGLRVLVRADLNVPLDGGRVADDGRTAASSARNSAIWPALPSPAAWTWGLTAGARLAAAGCLIALIALPSRDGR